MIDGFGPTGADGMYKRGMESSFGILRNNKDTLLSVLEPFVKDPVIDWRRHRNQQSSNTSSHKDSFHRAKRSVSVIQERLSGVFISRNPNYRRLKNIIHDYGSHKEDNMAELLPLSVAGQVQKLCLEATKKENLVQLYVGWMPWL
jgi:serine/threonine-protein kinase ATR